MKESMTMNRFSIYSSCAALALVFTVGCDQSPPPVILSKTSTQTNTQANTQTNTKKGGYTLETVKPTGQADTLMLSGELGEASLSRNFYFVFDGSGSMKGDKLTEAKKAVSLFMKQLPDDVHLGLYVFDQAGSREVLELGADNRSEFITAIKRVKADKRTPLGASIRAGTSALSEQYKRQLGYGEYRLVVVTDGEASDDLAGAVRDARKKLIPIYTIGYRLKGSHTLRKDSVSYQDASNAKDLQRALTNTLAETESFDASDFKGFSKD